MEWIGVIGLEQDYMVSSTGLVKSIKTFVNNKKGTIIKRNKIMKKRLSKEGYEVVMITHNGKQKLIKVHRLVCCSFMAVSMDTHLCVNHKDFNKINNNIENLELITNQENLLHARINGRIKVPSGKDHYRYKLTEEIKEQILNMKKRKVPNKLIAKEFGIHEITIYKFYKPTKNHPIT